MTVSVCLSLCLSVCMFVRDHISGTTEPIFSKYFCMLPMAVTRFSWRRSDTLVLPVILMTSHGCLTSPPSRSAAIAQSGPTGPQTIIIANVMHIYNSVLNIHDVMFARNAPSYTAARK